MLVVWYEVGHGCGEELGPFCWPMLAAGIAVLSASHWFTEHTSQICNGVAGIKKAIDQTNSRPPNSDGDLFLVQVWCWEVLWNFFLVQPQSWSLSIGLSYNIHFSSHITIWSRNGSLLYKIREDDISKSWFFDFWSAHEAPAYQIFHLSNLLQMLSDCRMVDTEFFGNFSSSCKRINLDDFSQFVVVTFPWLATRLLIFKALVSARTITGLYVS